MTTLFYKALIFQGEIWCWSVLGLKGLTRKRQTREPERKSGEESPSPPGLLHIPACQNCLFFAYIKDEKGKDPYFVLAKALKIQSKLRFSLVNKPSSCKWVSSQQKRVSLQRILSIHKNNISASHERPVKLLKTPQCILSYQRYQIKVWEETIRLNTKVIG